jgi:hypothetical protein
MAMVYGLVKQHQGFIDIDTVEGKGTTIRMYFPSVATPYRPAAQVATSASPRGGHERILVVDDRRADLAPPA